MSQESISIAILCGGREDAFRECLKSLVNSIKQSGDKTAYVKLRVAGNVFSEELINYMKELPVDLEYYPLPGLKKSALRNFLLDNAEEDIIYFIDDDVTLPGDFAGKIRQKFQEYSSAAAIGGPNLTPPDATLVERAQGAVLSSKWGGGSMSVRYTASDEDFVADESSFALCNLGFRRDKLNKHSLKFDERLYYNEENDLLNRLSMAAEKLIYTPEIILFHRRRKKIFSFLRQVFESGRGRARSVRIDKNNAGVIYFIPLIFFLYVILIPPMGIISPHLLLLYAAPLILHIIISFIFSLKILFSEKSCALSLLAFILFPAAHLTYGAGTAAGLTGRLG